jgi:hypothetical protein
MKNKDVSFPHPVLGIGDAVSPMPSVVPQIREEGDDLVVTITLLMQNEDIMKLIHDEYATFACEIDCPSTFYRRILYPKETTFDVRINRKEIARRVTIECTVTALKSIKNYSNSQFHPDYTGFSFNLEPGDLLAFIGKMHYDADIKYDKLQSAGSFMTIVPGHDEKNTVYYLRSSKIEIQLPKELYEDYKVSFNGPGKHVNIFHSSIVLNALVYALLNYDDEQYGNTLWARTLKYRIELEPRLRKFDDVLENKDPIKILEFAQALLDNPYKKLLQSMHDIIDSDTSQQGY